MIEGVLAWFMLFIGLATGNPLYLIACGAFAVAAHIGNIGKYIDNLRKGENKK